MDDRPILHYESGDGALTNPWKGAAVLFLVAKLLVSGITLLFIFPVEVWLAPSYAGWALLFFGLRGFRRGCRSGFVCECIACLLLWSFDGLYLWTLIRGHVGAVDPVYSANCATLAGASVSLMLFGIRERRRCARSARSKGDQEKG